MCVYPINSNIYGGFQENTRSKLETSICPTNSPPDVMWEQIKTAILQASNENHGFSTKYSKKWCDENNQEIKKMVIEKRSALLQVSLDNPSPLFRQNRTKCIAE